MRVEIKYPLVKGQGFAKKLKKQDAAFEALLGPRDFSGYRNNQREMGWWYVQRAPSTWAKLRALVEQYGGTCFTGPK